MREDFKSTSLNSGINTTNENKEMRKMEITLNNEELDFNIKRYDNRIFFILKGKKGAITFSNEFGTKNSSIDYHALNKKYDNQKGEACMWNDDQISYCDGKFVESDLKDIDILKKMYNEYKCLN